MHSSTSSSSSLQPCNFEQLKCVYERVVKQCNFEHVPDMTPDLYQFDIFGVGFTERGQEDFLEGVDFIEMAMSYIDQLIKSGPEHDNFNETRESKTDVGTSKAEGNAEAGGKAGGAKSELAVKCEQTSKPSPTITSSPASRAVRLHTLKCMPLTEFVCRFLLIFAVALSNRTNSEMAITHGVILKLTSLAQCFRQYPFVVTNVLQCLSRLSYVYRPLMIEEEKLLDMVVDVLTEYDHQEDVVRCGIKVINNLARSFHQMERLSVCEILVPAMLRFRDNTNLQRSAAHVLEKKWIRNAPEVKKLFDLDENDELVHLCTRKHVTVSLTQKLCGRCNRKFVQHPEFDLDPLVFSKGFSLNFFDPPHTEETYASVLEKYTPLPLYNQVIISVVNYLRIPAELDQKIDVLDCVNKWCLATICNTDEATNRIQIHYDGFGHRWDEWMDAHSERIAYPGTYTKFIKNPLRPRLVV